MVETSVDILDFPHFIKLPPFIVHGTSFIGATTYRVRKLDEVRGIRR
jgi:hypothetical protein